MEVRLEIRGGLGYVVLSNRPHNALTDPVFADRADLARFFSDESIRGVVVAGEGKHFSSGADVEALGRTAVERGESLEALMDEGKGLLDFFSRASVPVVAAVRGSCLGAGLEIALACHFVFAAQSAMLGFPEVEHGLIPGFGGPVLCADRARRSAAVELLLSGRMIGADEALEIGLVDRVAPASRVEREAEDFLRELTEGRPRYLVRAAMESMNNALSLPRAEALREETRLFCGVARRAVEEDRGD